MFTLTFTEDQMVVLDRALQEIPFKHAAPIIQSINEQIRKAQPPFKEADEIDVTGLNTG